MIMILMIFKNTLNIYAADECSPGVIELQKIYFTVPFTGALSR